MEFKSILKKSKEKASSCARKGKRTRSPPGSGDEVTPHKRMKCLEYSNIYSKVAFLTSPGSCDNRQDESSDSPSTAVVRPKLAGKRGIGDHANAILDLQCRLQMNYNVLKEKMEPTELADRLHYKGMLDTKSLENIKKGNDRRMKNDMLLKELCRIKGGNRENIGYDRFISLLNETGQGNLVNYLETIQRQKEVRDLPLLNDMPDAQSFIEKMKETLLEEVEPRMFLDDIVGNGGLSMKEHEEINTKPKRRERIETLLAKVKSAKDSVAIKIVRYMADAFPDLYNKYESVKKGNNAKQQKEAVKQEYSVPVGSPLQMKFQLTAGNCTSSVQDTNEHTDPVSEMRKKRREAEEIERRIVNNLNENDEQLKELLETCISELKQVKFSCIKIYLKSLSKESLGKLVAYSRSGAAKRLLLSLIDEETKQKLLDMNAKIVLEISHGFEKECLCHLNKATVTLNFTALTEGIRCSRSIIKRFLQSHGIGDRRRPSLKEILEAKRLEERNRRLLQFLLKQDLPDVFFCILEDEIVKHDGTDIIHSTLKSADLTDYEVLTKADIRDNISLLVEELEARVFIHRLGLKPDRDANNLVEILLTSESRDQRIRLFLQYLLRENDLSWFSAELKIRNKHLFDIMVSRKASNKTSLFGGLDFGRIKTATYLYFDDIIEEVDPLLFTKRLGKRSQKELRSSNLEDIPKRSDRALQFCLSLLDVSPSTFNDALNMMTSCGYKDIVDNITALAREGPLNSSYKCPKLLCLDQCEENVVSKSTFTLDEKSTEVMKKENTHPSNIKVDNLRHSDSPPIRIKFSSKSRVQSVKGESESGIFSGSGTRTEDFNTDEDSDYENRRSEVDKRKMTTEWIVSHSKSESFGNPIPPIYMHMDETRSHLPEEKGPLKKLKGHGSCVL